MDGGNCQGDILQGRRFFFGGVPAMVRMLRKMPTVQPLVLFKVEKLFAAVLNPLLDDVRNGHKAGDGADNSAD